MNGLLPYNNAGLVDPFANAMQGGLGQMYAIQDTQAMARDKDQEFLSQLNKYNNDLADNPLKEAERKNKLSEAGLQGEMYADNTKRSLAYSEADTKQEVNKGLQAQSKTGPQLELAAQTMGQFATDMKAIEQAGGGLAQQEYWKKNVAPVLQKMGKPTDFAPDKLYKLNDYLQNQTAQAKHMQGINATNQMHENVANIAARAAMYGADNRGDDKGMNKLLVKYYTEHPDEIPDYVMGIRQKNTASTAAAEERDPQVMMLSLEQMRLKRQLRNEEDPKERVKLQKQINDLDQEIDSAKKKVSPATRSSTEPTQPTEQRGASIGNWISKNGMIKDTDTLSKVPVTKADIGATVEVGGKKYKLTEKGWE